MIFVCQVQLHIRFHRLGRVKGLALTQLFGKPPARQFQHRHHLGAFGRPQAFNQVQLGSAGVEQARQTAKGVQQLLRQLKHVFTRHAGAQQNRQQFHIAECAWTARQHFFARACVQR